MRKPAYCICEYNVHQLRCSRAADQRLCVRNRDSAIHLKSQASSHLLRLEFSLCDTRSETPKTGFFRDAAHIVSVIEL